MTLINDPQLLILDEPVNGLDPDGIVEIRELIKKINEKNSATVLFSSHILNEVYQIADHYILINHGEIIEQVSRNELAEDSLEEYFFKKMGG